MSNEAQAWAFSQPLPPAPKLVLLALANNANKEGKQCFPSLRLIVDHCRPMRSRTVQYHLKWLADKAKLITVTPWFTPSGRQTSNLYELDMTTTYCGEGAESCTLGDVPEMGGEGAESCTGEGAESCTGEGARALAPGRVQKVAPPDQNLDLQKNDPKKRTPVGARGARRREPLSSAAWEGYRRGHHNRYGIEPVRDPTTNTVLCSLVRTFGHEEAAQVAEFYFSLNRKVYVENKHPPNLLMRDRFGIRTEMKTGPVRAPVSVPKAFQSLPPRHTQVDECPPDAAAMLSRIRGKTFSFPADDQQGAA